MSAITLAEARENRSAWLAASLALAKSQAYTIHGRSLTRANAAEVREMVNYWSRIVSNLERGSGSRVGVSLVRFR